MAGFGPWAWFALPCPAPAGKVVHAPAAVTTPTIHKKTQYSGPLPKDIKLESGLQQDTQECYAH